MKTFCNHHGLLYCWQGAGHQILAGVGCVVPSFLSIAQSAGFAVDCVCVLLESFSILLSGVQFCLTFFFF